MEKNWSMSTRHYLIKADLKGLKESSGLHHLNIHKYKYQDMANSLVYIPTNELYPMTSFARNRLAASTFKGESGSGLVKSILIASQVVVKVHVGDQAEFSKSRQISPVLNEMLG